MCLFAWHCRVVLEGFSTFVVNSDGQISLHKMDKVLYCIAVASFPVLPTPAFVSQPWRKSASPSHPSFCLAAVEKKRFFSVAARQKLGWEGLGTRLTLLWIALHIISTIPFFLLSHTLTPSQVMPAPKEKSRVRTWIAQLGVILGLTPRPSLKPQPVVDFAEK